MSVPVIFIQKGYRDYFKYVVNQAKNNDNIVFVLDDDAISRHSEKANEFSTVYEHLSTNNLDIELLCFNRWFILQDFMNKQGIDRCLHLDTDVLLYVNAEKEIRKFEQFEFTLSHRCCGSNSFLTLNGLTGICDFIMRVYADKNSYDFEKIASHYHIRQKHRLLGGVCDMTLLEYYAYFKQGLVGETMHIIDDSTYDHNINVEDQYFQMQDGIKKISFNNRQPYCQQISTGKHIKFNTLHFQGSVKDRIPYYVS